MRISAIIPVFNRQDLGMRAVRSALAQSYSVLEVIAVDDGSAEPFTPERDVADDARLRIIRLPSNAGASAARNAGVAAAAGEWIAFLDSDDIWEANKLEQQIAFVKADPLSDSNPLVLYGTGFKQIYMRSGHIEDRIPVSSSEPRDFASGCWYAPGSTALMAKSTFETIGLLDTNLRRLEDLDWAIRLALAGGRISIAPFIGSKIEVGTRPRLRMLQATCEAIADKWSVHPSIRRIPGMKRRLDAYLDIERSAACHYEKNHVLAAFYLARSLVRAPRTTLQLKSWWRSVSAPSS